MFLTQDPDQPFNRRELAITDQFDVCAFGSEFLLRDWQRMRVLFFLVGYALRNRRENLIRLQNATGALDPVLEHAHELSGEQGVRRLLVCQSSVIRGLAAQ